MPLIREPIEGKSELITFPYLLTGPPGLGKSSFFASAYPKLPVFYADCDETESLIAHTLPKQRCQTWAEFVALVKDFLADEFFRWLCIDTLNGAYLMCNRTVCEERGVKHPGEINDFGATWNEVTRRFMTPLKLIVNAGKGLLATSHTTLNEVFIQGKKFNRWMPSIPGGSIQGAYAQVESFFMIIGFLHKEGGATPPTKMVRIKDQGDKEVIEKRRDVSDLIEQRVVYFQPGENWVAKDRSGRLPEKVVLPADWRDDWQEFSDYFTTKKENN